MTIRVVETSGKALSFRRRAASTRTAAQVNPSYSEKLLALAAFYDEQALQADLEGMDRSAVKAMAHKREVA